MTNQENLKKGVYHVQIYRRENLSFGILDMSKGFEMINVGIISITNVLYSLLKNNHSSKFILSFRVERFVRKNFFFCFDNETKSYYNFRAFSPEYVTNFNFLFHKRIVKNHDELIRVLEPDTDSFDRFYNENVNGFDLFITLK
jgi:hypothetical protein